MELFIDIGNTLTCFKVNKTSPIFYRVLTKNIENDEKNILDVVVNNNISKVAISSVVPIAYEKIMDIITRIIDPKNIFTVKYDSKVGFEINIDDKTEIGADLMCDLEAVVDKFPLPAIIIDVGTATKILYLPKDKVFTSCAIFPGLELSYKVLSNGAALLREVNASEPKALLDCHNTNDVVNSSIIFSHADSINGIVARLEKETNTNTTKIITGGYTEYLLRYLNFEYTVVKDLTLLGVEEIYRKN